MRRLLRPRWNGILLAALPFLIGLGTGLVVQASGDANLVYLFQFRADQGSILIILGALVSVIWLGIRGLSSWSAVRAQSAAGAVKHEAALSRRRFLSRLDHELKNPLTALRTALAFLSESNSPQEIGQVASDMTAQTERLSRLVNDLRKLAQLEEQDIERQPVDIEDLLAEVVEAAQDHPASPERDVRLTLLHRPWPLPAVSGDRGLLWLACYNLLENALKFTLPGAEIELRAFESSPWLVIEVADNGPGIPETEQPYIFEELYRGSNMRGHPGSGLGLALVRAVASLHDGTVTVRSRIGQGTVFTLQLPV